MSKKLPSKKLQAMFRSWCDRQSLYNVAKTCKVAYATVRKYREIDNWDARFAEIKTKATAKADENSIGTLAESIQLVRFCKSKLLIDIQAMHKGNIPLSKAPITDLDKLVRLELLLSGLPDSRVEQVQPDDELEGKSIEELLSLRARLVKAAKGPGGNGNGNGNGHESKEVGGRFSGEDSVG